MRASRRSRTVRHAGAIISQGMGTAESKVKAFADAGVAVARYPREIPELIRKAPTTG